MMTMMACEKRVPLPCLTIHVVFQENGVRGFVRFSAQRHVRLFRSIVSFFGVTFFTSRSEVQPRIATTAGTGYNMIDRQLFFGAAVLALVIIALEYILPGKINALVRGVNISVETNYGWHWITFAHRMKLVPVGSSHHFTFVEEHQNKGTLYRAYH